jgi:hypothetical protein
MKQILLASVLHRCPTCGPVPGLCDDCGVLCLVCGEFSLFPEDEA